MQPFRTANFLGQCKTSAAGLPAGKSDMPLRHLYSLFLKLGGLGPGVLMGECRRGKDCFLAPFLQGQGKDALAVVLSGSPGQGALGGVVQGRQEHKETGAGDCKHVGLAKGMFVGARAAKA